jgi:hypothetical protein
MKSFIQKIVFLLKMMNKDNLVNPILIYQMGKVASSSIYTSIKSMKKINVFHIHRLNPDNIKTIRQTYITRGISPPNEDIIGLYLLENVIKPRKPAKIISLVREPIGRNISAYFQNLDSFEKLKNTHKHLEVNELIDNFLTKYNHDVPLNWFDVEMKNTVGIDVFKYDFPKELGFQTILSEPYELLLLRHDLKDSVKIELIANFLNLPSFSLKVKNVGASKNYGSQYKAVLNTIKVPPEYADKMLGSKYAQHFYTDKELDLIRQKWVHP